MKYDIITFGSAVVDVFVHTDMLEKNKEICYPTGGKILIDELKFDIGGGGTNTAVAFSRLGLKTGCICNVGEDENGQKIISLLKKENVKFLGKIDKKGMTGYSIILDSRGGERTILTYKGANDDISDLSFKELDAKWLYLSALLKKSFITQKNLALFLNKRGVKIAYNPSSYIIDKENILSLLQICEVLIVNKEEADCISRKYGKKWDVLESLKALGPKIVIITNKDKEAWCYDGKQRYKILPHKNIKVVERTGAGDAFASGFVAGLIAGFDIEKCLEFGLKESESVLTHMGAKNNLIRMNLKK